EEWEKPMHSTCTMNYPQGQVGFHLSKVIYFPASQFTQKGRGILRFSGLNLSKPLSPFHVSNDYFIFLLYVVVMLGLFGLLPGKIILELLYIHYQICFNSIASFFVFLIFDQNLL
ncbi:hypothetical protein ACJX0J_034267, partial [Zea mays]